VARITTDITGSNDALGVAAPAAGAAAALHPCIDQEVLVSTLLALVAASQLLYEASVPSFGCTSLDEVSTLQGMRADDKAFQTELYQQIFTGQCVEIPKGQLVVGSADEANAAMLLVDREIEPPGYLAPAGDFAARTADEKK
jgi:hypothetical protein